MNQEISFPSLGLSFNPSRVAFNIGSKPIYWYGIIIALGFLLAVTYVTRRSRKFGLTEDNVLNMLLCAVPAAIVFARAYYVLFSWETYKANPVSMLFIWEGGLAIYGGIIGAVLAVIVYTKIARIPTSTMLDLGGLGLLIGQSIGRWGNFINREAHGGPTDTFFRMGITDASGITTYVHPTFLYESLWNALGFVLLHVYSKKRKYDGELFVMYLGWYGLGRVFIEGLRTDSLYVMNTNLRVSQLVAGLCVLFAVVFLFYNWVFREHDPEDLFVSKVAAKAAVSDRVESEPASDSEEMPEIEHAEGESPEPEEPAAEEPSQETEAPQEPSSENLK